MQGQFRSRKLGCSCQSQAFIMLAGRAQETPARSMVDLKTLKNKVKVAMHTSLCPQLRNDTRWGSTYAMLVKYLKLSEATNHFRDCSFKAGTRNLIPKLERLDDEQLSEHEVILEMVETLKEFEMVTKWLQTENSPNPKKKSLSTPLGKYLIDFARNIRLLCSDLTRTYGTHVRLTRL